MTAASPGSPSIAFLSCNYGGGHNRVAEVLAREVRARRPEARIQVLDYIETFVGHAQNVLSTFCYVTAVRRAPWTWRWFYRATSRIPYDSPTQRALNSLGKARLERFLAAQRPDLVVCTYCVPAGAISELRAAGRTAVPCATVITDHAVHSQWIHPHVDQYLVSSDYVRAGLVARGVPPDRVATTGIPIDPRFGVPHDVRALRRRYGLHPDVPVILVMVGAANLLRRAADVYRALAELPVDAQVVWVCGRDERLRRTLEALAPRARNPVTVLGYVEEVHELMAAATLMVSKAGGVTTSEAFAAELPVVVINPIPGQEEENVRFVEHLGAGVQARSVADLGRIVTDLLSSPGRLDAMRAAAARVKRPDAAARAAEIILRVGGLLPLVPAGRG
ncbi:MAG: glycosyltransferase [Armatimonadota bacterium]|nr:glycosyltransferase [Armatimonadota bacterium]MDR7455076.1 glycosyltransferase [Armatimonadota bacterium]MDR7456084.1 glycosyltransferase [Armatimonadota bacterium]MDR7495354.1 glycosyltransferase [Armatimonadota bacterium]MDR7512718.1 glycosyltransferase [Armatimonadota bacterium]